ncbi:UrcA family protein [Sphingomonas lenta]|uniref:UrcA family protein n=1 Tax=Sphingomonas lenta TaxID=1141887 RepID=A0A2A2SBD6_9SPHN|nr:UrcA family protein [Sphingomonas lenta]PAX06567.1 hypothetical protein CKY28_15555 [Sphingomonas lenta]
MIKTIVLVALALAPTPALAQQHTTPPTARVAVSDLDLTTADGVRTFDRRLRSAVNAVCPDGYVPDLQQRKRHRMCVQAARRSIAEQRERILASIAAPVRLGAVAR